MRRSAVRTRLAPFALALGLFASIAPIAPPLLALDGDADITFSGDGFVSWTDGGAVELADVAVNESTGAGFGIGNIDLAGVEPALHWKGWSQTGGSLDQGCAQATSTLFSFGVESEGRAGLVDSSGNLVVAGWAAFVGSESTRRAIVARFDLSGPGCVLDDDFSGNGWALFDDTSWCDDEECEVVDVVEIRPATGAVLAPRLVFLVRSEVDFLTSRFFLLGLTSAGALDTGFDGNGWKEVLATGDGDLSGRGSLAVDAVGGIYVQVARFDPTETADLDSALYRFHPNGALDSLFGSDNLGTWYPDDGGPGDPVDSLPVGLAASSDGFALTFAQYTSEATWLAAYGELVEGSGMNARADQLPELVAGAIVSQGDGRIVVVGEPVDDSDGFELQRRRLDFDGFHPMDGTFGAFGFRSHDLDLGGTDSETATAIGTWGGRIVVAGTATTATGKAGFLLRTQNAYVFADGFERGTAALWTSAAGLVFPE